MRKTIKSQRWLLLGNCQTHGLAAAIVALSRGIQMETYEENAYLRFAAEIDARLHVYDRILVMPGVDQHLPPALEGDPRVIPVPPFFFIGFQPDCCFLAAKGPLAQGPLGTYQSAIAYVAYRHGFTEQQTIDFYGEDTYHRLGYFDAWGRAKSHLLQWFAREDYDVADRFLRWSRSGVFMHTVNHPRIDLLVDLARMVLERAGVEIVEPGFLPQDGLVNNVVFPVYPEIASALGVAGSYRFKPGASYQMLDLDELVHRSFAAFRLAGDEQPSNPVYSDIIAGLSKRLVGELPGQAPPTRSWNGSYRSLFSEELAERGDFPACFAFGLHRSGSSLMHSMISNVCRQAGIPAISVPDRMFVHGLNPVWQDDPQASELFEPGRVHFGFRMFPPILKGALADARSVVLVREPVDALVSRFYAANGPYYAARARGEPEPDLDEFVLGFAGIHLQRMLDYRDLVDGGNVLVRRYEDVYFDKRGFLRDVFDHFGVRVPARTLARIAAEHEVRPEIEDPVRHRIRGTVIDCRRPLRPETRAQLNALFSGVAAAFGYALDDHAVAEIAR